MEVKGIDDLLAQLRASAALVRGKAPPPNAAAASGPGGFSGVLKAALDQVNGAQQEAGRLAREFEMGSSSVNLHDVMISMQKANVSFQAMVQVRNRLVSAYHDIMNMQV